MLNKEQSLALRFFATGEPSSSHFLKLALSKRALPLFEEIPKDFEVGPLDLIVFKGNVLFGEPSTPS